MRHSLQPTILGLLAIAMAAGHAAAAQPAAREPVVESTLDLAMRRGPVTASEPAVTIKSRADNGRTLLDISTRGASLAQVMQAISDQVMPINYDLDARIPATALPIPDMTLRGVAFDTFLRVMVERTDARMREDRSTFSMRQMDNIYLFQVQTAQRAAAPPPPAASAVEFIPIGPLLDAMGPAANRRESLTTILSALDEGLAPMTNEPAPVVKLHEASSMLIIRGNQRQVQSAQSLVRALSLQAVARKEQEATSDAALTRLQEQADSLSQLIVRLTAEASKNPSESLSGGIDRYTWQVASLRRQIDTIHQLRLTRPLVLPGMSSPGMPPWWGQSDPLATPPAPNPGGAPASHAPSK